jgi:phage replication O-like protein O
METIDEEKRGASPQAEDGHLDLANELVEAFARINLSAYEWRLLWALWRKTYCWHKKQDKIAITQFEKMTGLKRRHVARTLLKLKKRNIITQIGNSFITTYQFQKDYTKWKYLPVTQIGNGSNRYLNRSASLPKQVTNSLPKQVPTKENKETIQKNIGRSKKKTDPTVKEFLTYWGETFQREVGQPYVFSFGKDGNLIKQLLAVHDLPTLQDVTKIFFKDEQCKRRGLTIGVFFQEINRLLSGNKNRW